MKSDWRESRESREPREPRESRDRDLLSPSSRINKNGKRRDEISTEYNDSRNGGNNIVVKYRQNCRHHPTILNDPERIGGCNPHKRHTPCELSLNFYIDFL